MNEHDLPRHQSAANDRPSGVRVINISLTASSSPNDDCKPWLPDPIDGSMREMREAIADAWRANMVVLAAAGNEGTDSRRAPADCPHVLSVGNSSLTITSLR